MYRVEYMGVHCAFFPTRDLALEYFLNALRENPLHNAEDYEILDESDY